MSWLPLSVTRVTYEDTCAQAGPSAFAPDGELPYLLAVRPVPLEGDVVLDVASPPARRTRPATWLDPRLLGGVLLILVSVAVGTRVVAAADKTVPVYAAATDLPVGHVIAAGDLEPVRVRLSAAAVRYVAGTDTVVGRVIAREVRTGELVAASAVVARAPAPFRDVSVSVKPEHIASNIAAGSTVDVIATGASTSGGTHTWTVAKGLEVVDRSKTSGGFTATDARIVLKVPAELVLPLTAAMRSAEIDVVRVPQLGNPGDIGNEAPHPLSAPSATPPPR